MSVISLVGLAGSGKTTVADYLVEQHGFIAFSFADCLKDTCALVFCWDRDLVEGTTPEARVWREQVDEWWAERLGIPHFTPRWALRHIGTQLFRHKFHEETWTLNTERRISMIPEGSNVVLTDVRFSNELAVGERIGATSLMVERPAATPEWVRYSDLAVAGDEGALEALKALEIHESEWRTPTIRTNHRIVNDGTLTDLYGKVRAIL